MWKHHQLEEIMKEGHLHWCLKLDIGKGSHVCTLLVRVCKGIHVTGEVFLLWAVFEFVYQVPQSP